MLALLLSSRNPYRSFLASLSVLLAAPALSGCDMCREEALPVVTMVATIDFEGQSTLLQLRGEPSGIDFESLEAAQSFLLGSGARSSQGATWFVEAQSPSVIAAVLFQLTGPLAPGDVVDVDSTMWGGNFGASITSWPAIGVFGSDSILSFTSSASGTFQILGVSPLRLAIDVLTANDEGQELRISGEMGVTSRQESFCN
jgi:hypothetical protein